MVSIEVSRKRVGVDVPAFAQTISGVWLLFQVVTCSMIRSFSAAFVTSAEI